MTIEITEKTAEAALETLKNAEAALSDINMTELANEVYTLGVIIGEALNAAQARENAVVTSKPLNTGRQIGYRYH